MSEDRLKSRRVLSFSLSSQKIAKVGVQSTDMSESITNCKEIDLLYISSEDLWFFY